MRRFYHGLITLLCVKSGPGTCCRAAMGLAACLMLCFCWPMYGQQTNPQPGQSPARMSPGQAPIASDDHDPMAAREFALLAAKRNAQRQEQLVTDTNKLLLLAQQLKADVDKSNKDTLSISVIKKAEEIEKLAKSVKDKMKAQ